MPAAGRVLARVGVAEWDVDRGVGRSGRAGRAGEGAPGRSAGTAALRAWPGRRRFWALVGLALLGGLALRTAIGLTDDTPTTDETAYLRSGTSLAEGDGFVRRDGQPELHFPPLVPFVLGHVGRLVDDPHTGSVIVTVVAGTLAIVPLALIGRHLGGDAAGAATAGVAAVAPGLATLPVVRGAGTESEYVLLVALAVWWVLSASTHRGAGRLVRFAGAGACMGGAYLTRPEGLFIAVPLGLAVLLLAGRDSPGRGSVPAPAPARAVLRRGLAGAVAFGLPLLVCVVPYAAYLHEHTGNWELTAKTQDASIEAWSAVARGDRETRDGTLYALDGSGVRFSTERSSLPALATADPVGYLGIVLTNVVNVVTTLGAPTVGGVLSWVLLPLPLTVLAGWYAWHRRGSQAVRLLLAVAALPVVTGLMFFVQHRYLVVTAGVLTVLAGVALTAVPERRRRPVLAVAVVFLAASAVQAFRGPGGWWHPSDYTDQRRAGEWVAAHTDPDDVVMSRSMIVEHYAGRPVLALPYAELDEILRYGRHYGARYLVVDDYTVQRLRPQLAGLHEDGEVPGLRLVHEVAADGWTTRVFALDPAPPRSDEVGPQLGFVGDGMS